MIPSVGSMHSLSTQKRSWFVPKSVGAGLLCLTSITKKKWDISQQNSRNIKRRIIQHITTTSPCGRGPVTLYSFTFYQTCRRTHGHIYTDTHTYTRMCTYLNLNVTHCGMITSWFHHLTALHVTQRIVSTRRLCSNLFTVHPQTYYFHECISRHCITFIDF